MNQATLDRIRVMNKAFTNKLMIHIAGKRFGHFVVLTHRGRRSGTIYQIPLIAEPVKGGFIIALTYGQNVDWYKNVRAAGGGKLTWKKQEYPLVNPRFIDREAGLVAFPALFRSGLRLMGIKDFLQLDTRQ